MTDYYEIITDANGISYAKRARLSSSTSPERPNIEYLIKKNFGEREGLFISIPKKGKNIIFWLHKSDPTQDYYIKSEVSGKEKNSIMDNSLYFKNDNGKFQLFNNKEKTEYDIKSGQEYDGIEYITIKTPEKEIDCQLVQSKDIRISSEKPLFVTSRILEIRNSLPSKQSSVQVEDVEMEDQDNNDGLDNNPEDVEMDNQYNNDGLDNNSSRFDDLLMLWELIHNQESAHSPTDVTDESSHMELDGDDKNVDGNPAKRRRIEFPGSPLMVAGSPLFPKRGVGWQSPIGMGDESANSAEGQAVNSPVNPEERQAVNSPLSWARPNNDRPSSPYLGQGFIGEIAPERKYIISEDQAYAVLVGSENQEQEKYPVEKNGNVISIKVDGKDFRLVQTQSNGQVVYSVIEHVKIPFEEIGGNNVGAAGAVVNEVNEVNEVHGVHGGWLEAAGAQSPRGKKRSRDDQGCGDQQELPSSSHSRMDEAEAWRQATHSPDQNPLVGLPESSAGRENSDIGEIFSSPYNDGDSVSPGPNKNPSSFSDRLDDERREGPDKSKRKRG